jgi:hypothetical protein
MNAIYRRVLGAGLVLLAAGANAQATDTGWYFGLGLGTAKYTDDIPRQAAAAYAGDPNYNLLSARTTDSNHTAAQTFVGYRFTPWLGAEIGYQDLGDARTFYSFHSGQFVFNPVPVLRRGEYRVRDLNAALVVSWPVSKDFELLARGGFADTRLDYDEHGNDVAGNPYSFHARPLTRVNAQAGIGAMWRLAPHIALRLDLDRNFNIGKKFELNPDGNGRFDHIDAYTLNLVWKP